MVFERCVDTLVTTTLYHSIGAIENVIKMIRGRTDHFICLNDSIRLILLFTKSISIYFL